MVTKTPAEIDDMRAQIARGALPADAIEKYLDDEAKNVFGVDAHKGRHGYVEQGIGSKGHESANHFSALLKAENQGYEPKGTYQAAVAELWKRDPDRAKKLNLPQPQKAA